MTQPDEPRADDARGEEPAAPETEYHVEQAYSQAIPEQKPRVQVPPEAVATGAVATAPPARRGGAGRTLLVTLVAVASLMALGAAILFAAVLNPSKTGGETGSAPQSDAAPPRFQVGDCLYDVANEPKKGDCGNGGSPYRVVKVMPPGDSCLPDQASVSVGRSYCLTPNLNVNYCYSSPKTGGWIAPAARCSQPGTVTVVSVVPGQKNDKLCRGAWTNSYFYTAPLLTVCVREY